MMNYGRVLEPGRDYNPTSLYKLIRARVLTDQLREEFRAYRARLGSESVTRLESDRKRYTVFARIVEQPPLAEWALILGDIIHNYRAALDGFAWELAKLDGGVPANPKAIYFPMYTEREKWLRARARTYSSVPSDILDRMALVQPFVAEPVEKGVGLYLHQLDIDDKHRSELAVDLKARDKTSYSMRVRHENPHAQGGSPPRGFQWLAPDATIRDNMPIFRAEEQHRVSTLDVEKLPLVLEIASPDEPHSVWDLLPVMDLQVHRTFEIVSQGYADDDPNIWWRSVFSDR